MSGDDFVQSVPAKRKADTPNVPSTKRINPGGSSEVAWFNTLMIAPHLSFLRAHLFVKIEAPRSVIATTGCIIYKIAGDFQRIDIDKSIRQTLVSTDLLFEEQLPIKINAHHIALLKAGKFIPNRSPPLPPKALLTRSSATSSRFVASHLCHQKACINPDHLVWEPDWYNRLRDNCLAQSLTCGCGKVHDVCVHVPKCICSHRKVDVIDWHTL